MTYTVTWVPSAEQRLADIWLHAPDRDRVTRAAHDIDQRLRRDPENDGESRSNGRRILISIPLGVIFRVFPEDRLVEVLTVWHA
jgi:plasmid stabilization system protein ParE